MLSLVATLRGSPRVGSIRVAQRHGHPYMGGGFGNGSYWNSSWRWATNSPNTRQDNPWRGGGA